MRHLKIRGRLDHEACRQLVDRVESLVTNDEVGLDLAQTTYLDLPALAGLLGLDQALRRAGRRLILLNPSAPVRRVLALCHVGTADLISLTVG